MPHSTPEQLALAALGEPLPDTDAAHLAGCAQCSAEVAGLRRPVEVLAVPELSGTAPEVTPPPQVWTAIAAATGVSAVPPSSGAQVVPLQPRRSRTRWLTIAAAVLVGGVVGAGAVALTRDDDGGGAVVATAALDPLPAEDASGRAEVRDVDGVRSLQVDLDAPFLSDGYYEVWLLQPDAVRMVPVGVVHRGDTVLPLPDGLDLGAYPLVDVSVEPMDGDPTHSGVSVARGSLQR
ncbi:anti-sigma factor [Modestobacter altitudinis]|uniref:anti-sigma factor n=1 Tax=Modestobacter altitudinis TaxID=2213158 RepID=UPI00110D1C4A|nr:anti-sigma factor [Modestobacter altitudinis]